MGKSARLKQIFSWSMYDWANSAFATTVMAGLFPLFYKEFWNTGISSGDVTFRLGAINSMASFIVAVLAPLLGAMADQAGSKKKYLLFFALMGVVMTGLLFLAAQGEWLIASLLYVIALVGFSGGNIFYDALLVNVSNKTNIDIVSGLGFALGYLGGGILFAVNVWMVNVPATFGLDDTTQAVRISFLMVAVWWAVFSIPIFLFVKEEQTKAKRYGLGLLRLAWQQLRGTLGRIANYKTVVIFLLGYWFYIDGVDTVVRMAVDYGMSLGLDGKKLIIALLLTQFIGFPSALLFGFMGKWLGPKTGIYIGLVFYVVVIFWAMGISSNREFYILAICIGLVQGGVQALSRSLYVRIIPQQYAGEFFGFYNVFGKFAAVLGPILMGVVTMLSGDPRNGLLVIIILFTIGGIFLYFVDYKEHSIAGSQK